MITLTRLSLRRRSVTLLIAVFVLLGGTMALRTLNQELFPSFDAPYLVVTASQPGASPAAVVDGLARPIEDAVRASGGVRHVDSTSLEGLVVVSAEYDFGIDMADRQRAVRERLAAANLPAGVAPPDVERVSPDAFPVYALAVSGADPAAADRYADTVLRPALGELSGVASVTKAGGSDPVVSVVADPVKLGQVGYRPGDVADALRAANLSAPAGGVASDGTQLPVQLSIATSSVEEIRALPIAPRPGATPVTVGEVASVEMGESLAGGTISRADGQPAVTMEVRREQSANTVELVHRIEQVLERQPPPAGVRVTEVVNQAPQVRESVSGLARDAALGALLAVAIILVFLRSLRPTLVAAVSIPLSLFVAFLLMKVGHVSLNILTLGALSVAAGRVIDDAIVVLENIHRHLERGEERSEAVVAGTAEVVPAITASTLTTIAVFIPLGLVGGLVGTVFLGFALTVACALAASLLVAVTVVPVLADLLLRTPKAGVTPRTRASAAHRARLSRALDRRAATLGLAAAMLALSFLAASRLPSNVFPAGKTTGLAVTVHAPPGTSLRSTATRIVPLEDRLRTLPGVKSFTTVVGAPQSGGSAFFESAAGPNSVRMTVRLTGGADADALTRRIETLISTMSLSGAVSKIGSNVGSPDLTVTVTGRDFGKVSAAAADVEQVLGQVAGLGHISSNVAAERLRLVVKLDPVRTAAAGLDPPVVTRAVQQALSPIVAARALIGGSERQVVVTVDANRFAGDLRELPVAAGVNLGAVAEVFPAQSPTAVSRHDGRRSAEVRAVVISADSGEVNELVAARVGRLTLPAGVEASLGGLAELQRESFRSLGSAMGIAVLLVYLVMVLAFGSLLTPLVILLALPLAAIGAFPALLLSGHPMGMPAMIGLLMLIGIVVTNAIVLLDFVERERRNGLDTRAALLAGGAARLRPILMTAVATIGALIPLALGLSDGALLSASLAVVVIGGLLSSTLLTLVVVPVAYSLADGLRTRILGRRSEGAPLAEVVLPEEPPAELPAEEPADAHLSAEQWQVPDDLSEWAPPISEPTAAENGQHADTSEAWFMASDVD